MQIKIVHQDGKSKVSLVNPATDEVANEVGLAEGQALTLTAPDVHEPGGIEFGEVETLD